MAEYLIQDTTLQGIADKVRAKSGTTGTILGSEIESKIDSILTPTDGSIITQAGKTVTPTTSNITAVAANRYTSGNIIVAGDSNLKAANIVKGKSIFGVSGSYEGMDWDNEGSYTIESVSGASYGFALNSNGYYESENKGVNTSAAVCKVSFTSDGNSHLILDCINYAESNYDYALLSKIDTTLSTSSSADSTSNVFKSFKGQQSASVVTVDYGVVSAGTHFIYVKFLKDSSQHSNNDTLQFKVTSPTSVKNSIVNALENKGVDVSSDVELEDVAGLINSISSSGGDIGLATGAITADMWSCTYSATDAFGNAIYTLKFTPPIELSKLVCATIWFQYNGFNDVLYMSKRGDSFIINGFGDSYYNVPDTQASASLIEGQNYLTFTVIGDEYADFTFLNHSPGSPNYIDSYYYYLGDINDSVDIVGSGSEDDGVIEI